MEQVFSIKVHTTPDRSRFYPSERRYSSSTVGGLGIVHFVISILSSVFGILYFSLGGCLMYGSWMFLSAGAFMSGLTGIMAWKRWYVDKNINWFFFCSAISCGTSIICILMTTLVIANLKEKESWYSLSDLTPDLKFPIFTLNNFSYLDEMHNSLVDQEFGEEMFRINISLKELFSNESNNYRRETNLTSPMMTMNRSVLNRDETEKKIEKIEEEIKRLKRYDYEEETTPSEETNSEGCKCDCRCPLIHIPLSIIIASGVEFLLSLISLKISREGVRSVYPGESNGKETGRLPNAVTNKPDIISNHDKKSELMLKSLKENGNAAMKQYMEKSLKRCESATGNTVIDKGMLMEDMEYQERVQRFLASTDPNNPAHDNP